MPWGRLDDRANSDAKLLALSDAAWRMWGCGIIYCQFNLTNGFIPSHAIHAFGVRAKNKEAVADELCTSLVPGKAALWERVQGGYQVHDYLDWNDSKETVQQQRAASKQRLERFRKRKKKRVANTVNNEAENASGTPVQYHDHGELSEELESSRRGGARVFTGKRLKVSEAQHQVVLDGLGQRAGRIDLQARYRAWDAELEASGEAFDALPYIKRRAEADAAAAARAATPRPSGEDDWYRECQELHEGKCGGSLKHHNRMLIDADKVAATAAAGERMRA